MTINLRDYSTTAAQRGWGAGWPSCTGAAATGTAVVAAAKSGTRLSVNKRLARLALLVIDATEDRGYLLRPGQCWGYACRAIAGTQVSSNHAWGLAIDVNAPANPYTSPRRTDMPAWMPPLWNRYGFAWGGDYTGKQDSMHYEFMGTPADADVMTQLALDELTIHQVPSVSAPAPARLLEDNVIIPLRVADGGAFWEAVGADVGGSVAQRGVVTFGSTWGDTTFTVSALAQDGRVLAQKRSVKVANNTSSALELPRDTRAVTVEGVHSNPRDGRPWASVWLMP